MARLSSKSTHQREAPTVRQEVDLQEHLKQNPFTEALSVRLDSERFPEASRQLEAKLCDGKLCVRVALETMQGGCN